MRRRWVEGMRVDIEREIKSREVERESGEGRH